MSRGVSGSQLHNLKSAPFHIARVSHPITRKYKILPIARHKALNPLPVLVWIDIPWPV
jgi:hypothetical protein